MSVKNGQPKFGLTIQGEIMGNSVTRKNNEYQRKVAGILVDPPVEYQQDDGNKNREYGYEKEHAVQKY